MGSSKDTYDDTYDRLVLVFLKFNPCSKKFGWIAKIVTENSDPINPAVRNLV